MGSLINHNFAIDCNYSREDFVITIVLVRRDVRESHIWPVLDINHKSVVLCIVGHSDLELEVSTHHYDWPHAILIKFFTFYGHAVFAKLDFCELGHLVVAD